MSEKENNNVLDGIEPVLRNIQNGITGLRTEQKLMRSEIHEGFASVKGYLASFLKDQSILETRLAELEVRLDKVDRRLELVDDPHQ